MAATYYRGGQSNFKAGKQAMRGDKIASPVTSFRRSLRDSSWLDSFTPIYRF
jgi:hypothetical protein